MTNLRLYAIGDIHGRADLLQRLIRLIKIDLDATPAAQSLVITLGDYVDRGTESRKVLDLLSSNPFGTDYVALRGNHEAMLASFLDNPRASRSWRQHGGPETLRSYGVPVLDLMRGRGIDEAAAALREALPLEHQRFLRELRTHHHVGQHFFCHAGIRPGVPLDQQDEIDLLWIREEFLESSMKHPALIIHGHTPVEMPENLTTRINVDTGAYMTGRLTCVVLEDERRRFLST